MIVGNLYYIKSTNGLFYYGVDYLRESVPQVRKILVRHQLQAAARAAFPGCEVVSCTASRMIWEALRAAARGDTIYTPTSHPLPLVPRQWVVVHDDYPFTTGFKGRVKLWLLRWSIAMSRCKVAYINESEMLPFVAGLGVAQARRVFAPNRFPVSSGTASHPMHKAGETLRVGLVGTDSAKKNYSALFDEVLLAGSADALAFHVYGHCNAYFKSLQHSYPAIRLELVESDLHTLEHFFSQVHVLASVATQEGFGRPLAAALLSGWPCLLSNQRVFREFFDPGAFFFDDNAALTRTLVSLAAGGALPPVRYSPPPRPLEAYEQAVAQLKRLGLANA